MRTWLRGLLNPPFLWYLRHQELAGDVVGLAFATVWAWYRIRHEAQALAEAAGWYTALTEAAAPALLLFLVRDYFKYDRHGHALGGFVSMLNRPETNPAIRGYVRDSYAATERTVQAITDTQGCELPDSSKYEMACYLLDYQCRLGPIDGLGYCATMVGGIDRAMTEWETVFALPGVKEKKLSLSAAFNELVRARGRTNAHRRLLVVSVEEIEFVLSQEGRKDPRFQKLLSLVEWHAEIAKIQGRKVDEVLRVLAIKEDKTGDLPIRFREWYTEVCQLNDDPTTLVDFGIIGNLAVFGSYPPGASSFLGPVRIVTFLTEVSDYQNRFDALWEQSASAAVAPLEGFKQLEVVSSQASANRGCVRLQVEQLQRASSWT